MKRTVILSWLYLVALCSAQKAGRQQSTEWDQRPEAERANTKGCANLTLVLDNWKFAIMTQVKDLLLHDHSTVLPDYGREREREREREIQPLSEALGSLYQEFNMLKERLAELTSRFEGVEGFAEDMRAGRIQRPAPPSRDMAMPTATPTSLGDTPQSQRRRIIRKRIKHPQG
ncbi:hypothetical protein JZ751_019175 [Albula glossodonta]|uniref:Uncharacterized protein n=1 Tax=Albula glossodonta TaxID=121402 RepID=A0A8T2MV11_9TELE|nr:hypothetical protein JZ751_019175 [Albula glossodonta]